MAETPPGTKLLDVTSRGVVDVTLSCDSSNEHVGLRKYRLTRKKSREVSYASYCSIQYGYRG
jgi:hypothetical protein